MPLAFWVVFLHTTQDIMFRLTSVLLLATSSCFATAVQYLDYNSWAAAAATSPGTVMGTDDLSLNKFSLPGFSVTDCSGNPLPGETMGCGSIDHGAVGAFVNGQWTDGVGRLAFNGITGQTSAYQYSIIETADKTYAIGFQIAVEPDNLTSIFFNVNDQQFFPFGGGNPVTGPPGNSSEYSGFVGFVSDTPIDPIRLDAYGVASPYQIDTVFDATAVPEPATWTMLGSALLSLGVWRRKRRA